ncbi:ZnF_C3H1 [Nesidiocoris tenuis]|uniref:ZnF_C3H1 n=1 Tax=Nesidiocoris tenuis TaxID=355587 RepID=A0ABN7B6L2_9HEMI|nr:ZnF_C3H1 [Nesidiocoris tenuis]
MPEEDLEKRAICRDFMRNQCARGDSCKYYHPEKLVFCLDYQHGRCTRSSCAFLHCTKDDVDFYEQTGQLPSSACAPAPNRSSTVVTITKEAPICKDFLHGECERAICKYRHPASSSPSSAVEPLMKRRRIDLDAIFGPGGTGGQVHWTLEDENAYLRKAVADLRKRVDSLQATNEFLLEQNAQMRLSDKAQGLTAVTVPAAVTITNGQIQPQVSGAIRTVTASVATVPVSIAAVAAGTPVSIATVSMSPVMPAPSVTMATPHQGTTENAPALLSTTAGQLVSYPIVARPVITNLTH